MTGNKGAIGSDLAKLDAYEIGNDDYEEVPELTDRFFERATIHANGVPVSRPRGRPTLAGAKRQVTLRLDPDVLDKFRETGPGWQRRINEALRKAAGL